MEGDREKLVARLTLEFYNLCQSPSTLKTDSHKTEGYQQE